MQSLILSQINIYPIKSLGGISLTHSMVEERGLPYDRRWMLVDENNQFFTQRKFPQMALFSVGIDAEQLRVHFAGLPELAVPLVPETAERIPVTVWDDTCDALVVSHRANEWFSDALQMTCRLVYMPHDSVRPVDARYDPGQNAVSFADGYPFLLIGEASLADLNSRLRDPLPMNRFRPNLVIRTTESFVEDTWQSVRIGDALFYVVKPCARCVVTTINQETAEKGKEPLKTLATYRMVGNKIMFGQNLVYGKEGTEIRLGDEVTAQVKD